MDADQVLETYSGIDFASSNSLMGRAFTHVACEDLAVGNVVNSFNAGIFGAAHPISLSGELTRTDCTVHYCSQVGRRFVGCGPWLRVLPCGGASTHPKFLTFLLSPDGARRSVVRTRRYPSVLAEVVKMYQVALVGPSSRLQLAAAAVPGPLVYRSMES
jgi:hypothetical protein